MTAIERCLPQIGFDTGAAIGEQARLSIIACRRGASENVLNQ